MPSRLPYWTGKPLGKLAALTAGVDGRFSSKLSYQN